MSSRPKKRKTTGSPPSGEIYFPKEDLRDRLSKCRQKNIGKALLESIRTATPAELCVIQSLLTPLLESANVLLHCVRCHKSYSEPSNHRSACKIEHSMELEMDSGENARYCFSFPCCDEKLETDYPDGSEVDMLSEFCFRGLHTTDEEEVEEYYDAKRRSGNKGVPTCEEVGCNSG
ncbi:hypothetical protein FRC12_006151 [Ceratobasidium sp. 428]|nr:hypothetical protein FRC12_006151 [Ceratobasidium sp. 428]